VAVTSNSYQRYHHCETDEDADPYVGYQQQRDNEDGSKSQSQVRVEFMT